MDSTTFQICVANLCGQAALVNALSNAVELFQYEFQLIRSGVPYQNQRSCKVIENANFADRDASFQRLNTCLSNWKASIGASCLNGESSRNNHLHNNCGESSEIDGEECFTDTSSSLKTLEKRQVSQSNGNSVKGYDEVANEDEMDEETNIKREPDDEQYFQDFASDISSKNQIFSSEKYAKNLTIQEKILRKRAGDRRRSAAYRIRKKAAEAGLSPPDFAKLRTRRSERDKHNDEHEEVPAKEVEEDIGNRDHNMDFWENMPSKSPRNDLKNLTTNEKLLYKREMNKQRVMAYRMRKKAEKIGVPLPDFARLRYKTYETNSNRFGEQLHSNNSCSSHQSNQQSTFSDDKLRGQQILDEIS